MFLLFKKINHYLILKKKKSQNTDNFDENEIAAPQNYRNISHIVTLC